MSPPLLVVPLSASATPSLVAVERAAAELRRGGVVVMEGSGGSSALALAAESASPAALARLARLSGSAPALALTARRAAVLGLPTDEGPVVLLEAEHGLSTEQILALADPLVNPAGRDGLRAVIGGAPCWAVGAVTLAKLARLLPAVVVARANGEFHSLLSVSVDAVLSYQQTASRALRPAAEARVPLANAEETRVIAFRPADGGLEHLALVIGRPEPGKPVLTRLHSECFTGDLLGSLRCDCGDQLRGAISRIGQSPEGGVLLYLAQEGRGIGLVNKLRAYELQDNGFDTLDANQQLGFDDDERIYLPAAEMLRLLGFHQVRLLTNNPAKMEGLARHGIQVVERVPHVFPSNCHSAAYLHTKATRGGHLF